MLFLKIEFLIHIHTFIVQACKPPEIKKISIENDRLLWHQFKTIKQGNCLSLHFVRQHRVKHRTRKKTSEHSVAFHVTPKNVRIKCFSDGNVIVYEFSARRILFHFFFFFIAHQLCAMPIFTSIIYTEKSKKRATLIRHNIDITFAFVGDF